MHNPHSPLAASACRPAFRFLPFIDLETMMICLRRSAPWLFCAILFVAVLPAAASQSAFPFGSELMLDAAPMHGSKRVPMIEIDDSGAASIDLWCVSMRAQATVGGDTISIVPAPAAAAPCTPERQSDDEKLLTALTQATNWRRSGDVIELRGSTTLRFRLMTN
jgi:META domain